MSYCILRIKKLKSFASLACSCHHTFRDGATPNADAQRTSLNQSVGAKSTLAVLSSFRSRLPKRCRKNAVLGLEYLITASPEFFSGGRSQAEYFSSALKWLRQKHGSENVMSATIHRDETTPHLVAYVVPMTKDGRLSARDFCGGAKKLSQLQSDFHASVGAKFGLLRGLRGSKAKHRTIARFYSGLNTAVQMPTVGPLDNLGAAVGIETQAMREKREAERVLAVRASRSGTALLGALRLERRQARDEAQRLRAAFSDHKLRAQRVVCELRQHLAVARESVRLLKTRVARLVEELVAARLENKRLLASMHLIGARAELRVHLDADASLDPIERRILHVK